MKFGLAHQHTITHARKPKGARRTGERENEHAGSHLLQSRGSLNIRGAAYPLLPCVKPFTRLCHESRATRAAAGLQSVSVHGACACLYSVAQSRESDGKIHTHLLYLPASPPLET